MMTRTRILHRTLSWLAPLAVALTTLPASAQVHPNLERGFAADKAFQVGEIDHVNLFNGNVTLTIPLGATSTISEQLSLGLTATYNSKMWEMRQPAGSNHRQMLPDDLSNAGLGWVVTLGRLFGTAGSISFSYQGPDGAMHLFHESLHAGDPVTTGFGYTRDGTYLRLRQSGTHYFVEFPNGISQEFEPWQDGTETAYRLWATRDPHGNYFSIDYSVANEWTIKDQYDRKTIVRFAATPAPPPGVPYPSKNYETAVDSITIPGFNGQTSKYQFTYEAQTVRRAWCSDGEPAGDDKYTAVPLLKKIALSHGSTLIGEYVAEYDVSIQPPATGTLPESCKAGTLTSLKLPTQATIRWTYGTYWMPGDCRSELASDRSAGVTMRKYDAPTSGQFSSDLDGTWTYAPALTPETGSSFVCGNQTFLGAPPSGEMTNTVTSPSGDQTVHYFSVWQIGRTDGPHGETRDEFSLPFSRREAAAGDTMFLSTRVCKGLCTSPGNPVRTTYVAYERDFLGAQFQANRRLVKQKTVFNDDASHYVQTEYSNFDGVGNYRVATTSGDFGNGVVTRAKVTAFNVRDSLVSNSASVLNTGTYNSADGTGFTLPPTSHPWILDTFSSVVAIQDLDSRTQYACFDPLLGDLRATRVLGGVTNASTDLITVFDRSTDPSENGSSPGFITMESFYGGDKAPLQPTTKTALCDYVNATVSTDKPRPLGFRTKHTYSYGSRATSTFYEADGVTALPFKSLDLDIDPSGLAQTVRDTAGVATTYQYDASARLTMVSPPGAFPILYAYIPATSTTRANVTVSQLSNSGTIKREVHFDSMGRVAVEKRTNDSSQLQSRTTLYNAMGWRTSVTEWGSSSATTFSAFDAFGRPGMTVAPDGAIATVSHVGAREMVRTKSYRSPTGTASTTVTERQDPFGRLIEVAEQAGPTSANSAVGAQVLTKYGYDVADHLTSVDIMPAGGTTQPRRFVYDGRGLLTEESHPELGGGIVRYAYDARRHTTEKTFPSAGDFDLKFAYDAAERVTTVSTRSGGTFRISKAFDFGTTGTGKGRLLSAKRYNYLPGSSEHYLVTEENAYNSDGRFSTRTTKIERVNGATSTLVRSFSLGKTYNELGLPFSIAYPHCATCGSTARTVEPAYSRGLLRSIPGFIDQINYTANGMPATILHSNGITDTIMVSLNGLPRPASISFEGLCTAPQVTLGPPQQSIERNSTVTLVPSVSGTSPQYQWSKRPASSGTWSTIPGATGATLTIGVSEETFFRLAATNSCGTDISEEVRVIVFDKPAISVPPASQSISGGQTASLSVTASGTAPLSYQWYRGASGDTSQPIAAPAGTQSSYTTPILWATTSYWVRVSNAFGTANSQTATITVQLAAPTGLVATRLSNTQIHVTWNASAGAGQYRLQRRSGSGFVDRTTVSSSTLQFTDTTVLAGKTYVYRVVAEDSGGNSDSAVSNQDLATTIGFTPVLPLTIVADEPLHEILSGINALRLAADAGATQLTWANLVSPPFPANGEFVRSSPVTALRAHLNTARVALGFPNWPFTAIQPSSMRVIDMTELQDALR